MRPLDEPLMSSLFRSRSPPPFAREPVSFSFSLFFLKEPGVVSRGMRLPLRDQSVQLHRCGGGQQSFAKRLVTEHLR